MKKIPTLFEREYKDHKVVGIHDRVTPGMEWVLEGKGTATIKIDGSCCAIIGGELYKRYDAKKGKKPPEGAIPCCEPDPVTGHWPHWVKANFKNPADKWFFVAWANHGFAEDGTYEAVGPHFQGNPHGLLHDKLTKHGIATVEVERSFEGIRKWLQEHEHEGLVFWLNGEPRCKIKRSDFGIEWPIRLKHSEKGPAYMPYDRIRLVSCTGDMICKACGHASFLAVGEKIVYCPECGVKMGEEEK